MQRLTSTLERNKLFAPIHQMFPTKMFLDHKVMMMKSIYNKGVHLTPLLKTNEVLDFVKKEQKLVKVVRYTR